ncbi:6-hydroxymethylpterin diphosphokinase MptE-like protein [Metabacillus litoralis]|uniref:6-hydroxymethylpterin diphosphokinase MptE-like protein n=1 Tax=Metabacillus litoralis TaxID=152268 RepID=UPI0013CF1A26|nr:6-hydroxymethylpterin diphosphokinase MptE-like protein [Metabacillus litoralis]
MYKLKKRLIKIYNIFNFIISKVVNFCSKMSIPLTKNNFKIFLFKNRYKGKRCFIIGNGPSLIPEDLERLTGEYTFASNKIYKIFNKTTWRPTFYMVVDPIVLKENVEDINLVESDNKFTLKIYKHLFKSDIYFNNNLIKDKRGTFSKNIMESLYSSGTVSYHMLQIAFYMGFSEVYLIGHDYNFKGAVSKTRDLSFLSNVESSPIYFTENYIRKDEKRAGQAPDEMYKGMEKSKLVFEEAGRKVFNASRVSYLDVFKMKDFDELLGVQYDKSNKKIN